MSDIERQIADFMHEEVEGTGAPSGMYERVIRRARVWRFVNGSLVGATVIALVAGAVMAAATFRSPGNIEVAGAGTSPDPAPTRQERGDCPVTVPPQPGFVPPEPYPSEPPELYQAVWYGNDELWTMLKKEGEVWEGLPKDRHGLSQKTFWWAKSYSAQDEPAPPITVTGRQLDGDESFVAGAPGTHGIRNDIGLFMLMGLHVPAPGCWELTAIYKHAELSYVVWVQD